VEIEKAKMPSVLITGANRGLGFEFARQYAADGWHVLAGCRDPAASNQLQRLAQETKNRLIVFSIDVTNSENVRNAAKQLSDTAIDVLINNAGVAGPSGQKTGHIDYAAWAGVFDVNTMGPLRLIEAFTDHLARSERLVVTITSGMGSIAPL
jgi:NAD(P)-dependent dehydrogenase (short-subunit alcohol dehydrogenase family)